jgi:uncharacterized tellurite resistance protein B-like protein
MHALPQMKLLINLAQADGKVAEREKNYIINIGRANGIFPDQIVSLFQQEHPILIPNDLSADEKFEYIYTLVQLMKIDERMYQEEIRFCSSIAEKLGYDQEVLFELMLQVKTSPVEEKEKNRLKEVTSKYLKS